ncbi:MAG TPA: hypothetical protein VNY51_03085 [Candidatus Dormibacteraeota bacterium]|jgi:hypothetical protein|nr:hypothetical protein [Candidatus Dormibacteraeota bacterium]
MIDAKTVIEGIGAVAKVKELFRHDTESKTIEKTPQENAQNAAENRALEAGFTTEQLAILSIAVVACVAIIAIAAVAAHRGMITT